MPSGSRAKTESHEKSMGSYELFAWSDAITVAGLIDEMYGFVNAREIYESFSEDDTLAYEVDHQESIGEFIQKTELQRVAFLRQFKQDTKTKLLFLVLVVSALVRTKKVLEIRDRYRHVLVPGRGNRLTTAGIHAFSNEVSGLMSYEWPYEVFDAMGLSDYGE